MNSVVDANKFRNPGLDSKECLKILYDQIEQMLNDFWRRKFRCSLLVRHFFRKNKLEFVHNFVAVFLCSLALFASIDDSLFPVTSNAIILLFISFFNFMIILVVFVRTEKLVYSKAKNLLKLIEGNIFSEFFFK